MPSSAKVQKLLKLVLSAITLGLGLLVFPVGCASSGNSLQNDQRFNALSGRVRHEGESVSLYSTSGQTRRIKVDLKDLKPEDIEDIKFTGANDPVKKRSTVRWNSRTDRFYTITYKSRLHPQWQILPTAINIPGNGGQLEVIDNSPLHMNRTYRVRSSPKKIEGYRTSSLDPRRRRWWLSLMGQVELATERLHHDF